MYHVKVGLNKKKDKRLEEMKITEMKEIVELYKLYGFAKEDYQNNNLLLFSYQSGFFTNLEIVKTKNDEKTNDEVKRIKRTYQELGYNSIGEHYYRSLDEVKEKLFQAFFYPEENKKHLQKEYRTFCQKQNEKLQGAYQYIEGSFQDSTSAVQKNLVKYITDKKQKSNARLTIMEAAAGYGKTCTVYEILNNLLNQENLQLPLFVELSKNRNARLFRYVLQDEIDKKFTKLSYNLVVREIKERRIPLVIDGFDELIEQKGRILEDSDERSLSMLSTIAELLDEDSKAWILLTTRNSAIFSGDLFEEWVLSKLGLACEVDRVRIMKPSAKEWLGNERYEILKQKGILIEEMSNPVLLTFLKNLEIAQFKKQLFNQDSILQQYLSLLLVRDCERLELMLDQNEQYDILKSLSAYFAQYDITAESNEFIQELLKDILDDKMPELLERYKNGMGDAAIIQTDKEYIQRLSHSCLLDRISISENLYGFINEYILGILTGDALRDCSLSPDEISERYIDIIATAYEGREEKVRLELYCRINDKLKEVPDLCKLNTECALLHKISSKYKDQYFQAVVFPGYIDFSGDHRFENCIFDNCSFQNCKINAQVFCDCKFYNCQFYNIQVEGTPDRNLLFMNCMGEDELRPESEVIDTMEEVDHYEKIVLEQFWKSGYLNAELRRTYTALFKGVNSSEHGAIQKAIKSLVKQKLIRELNICYELNTNNMGEIKRILGRN